MAVQTDPHREQSLFQWGILIRERSCSGGKSQSEHTHINSHQRTPIRQRDDHSTLTHTRAQREKERERQKERERHTHEERHDTCSEQCDKCSQSCVVLPRPRLARLPHHCRYFRPFSCIHPLSRCCGSRLHEGRGRKSVKGVLHGMVWRVDDVIAQEEFECGRICHRM